MGDGTVLYLGGGGACMNLYKQPHARNHTHTVPISPPGFDKAPRNARRNHGGTRAEAAQGLSVPSALLSVNLLTIQNKKFKK